MCLQSITIWCIALIFCIHFKFVNTSQITKHFNTKISPFCTNRSDWSCWTYWKQGDLQLMSLKCWQSTLTIDHAQCFMLNHFWGCTLQKTVYLNCKKFKHVERSQLCNLVYYFVWLQAKSECWQVLVKILKTGPVGLLSYMWTNRHEEASSCFLHLFSEHA
jgi:hypothetical protein